jgi:hypothetical protein
MDETNVQLFGIAVILAGGFVMVASTQGRYPDDSLGYWAVLLSLGISFVALLRG